MTDEEYLAALEKIRLRSGRRAEELNQSRGVNMPLQLARGWAAGTAGLPGDIESLLRMLPLPTRAGLSRASDKTVLPTSEDILPRIPGEDTSPAGRAFAELGTLTGGAGAGTAARGTGKALSVLGQLAEDALLRGPAPGSMQAQRGALFFGGPKKPAADLEGLENAQMTRRGFLRAASSPLVQAGINAVAPEVLTSALPTVSNIAKTVETAAAAPTYAPLAVGELARAQNILAHVSRMARPPDFIDRASALRAAGIVPEGMSLKQFLRGLQQAPEQVQKTFRKDLGALESEARYYGTDISSREAFEQSLAGLPESIRQRELRLWDSRGGAPAEPKLPNTERLPYRVFDETAEPDWMDTLSPELRDQITQRLFGKPIREAGQILKQLKPHADNPKALEEFGATGVVPTLVPAVEQELKSLKQSFSRLMKAAPTEHTEAKMLEVRTQMLELTGADPLLQDLNKQLRAREGDVKYYADLAEQHRDPRLKQANPERWEAEAQKATAEAEALREQIKVETGKLQNFKSQEATSTPEPKEQKMLMGVYRGYAGEDPGEVVYHAGAEFKRPNPGLFTNPERSVVEDFQRAMGAPKLHTFEARPRRLGNDQDVYDTARRLGIYNPGVPASQYLEQGENAIFAEAPMIVEELRNQGLDALRLKDGMGKQPSLVALDPVVLRPAEKVFGTPQRRVADYYAQKRAAQTGEAPHVEMLLVDPFAGRQYGHGTMGSGKNPPMVTRARELKPEDVKSRTKLYAEGGSVQFDPDEIAHLAGQFTSQFTPGYAAGGAVKYDPSEIEQLVAQMREEFHA